MLLFNFPFAERPAVIQKKIRYDGALCSDGASDCRMKSNEYHKFQDNRVYNKPNRPDKQKFDHAPGSGRLALGEKYIHKHVSNIFRRDNFRATESPVGKVNGHFG